MTTGSTTGSTQNEILRFRTNGPPQSVKDTGTGPKSSSTTGERTIVEPVRDTQVYLHHCTVSPVRSSTPPFTDPSPCDVPNHYRSPGEILSSVSGSLNTGPPSGLPLRSSQGPSSVPRDVSRSTPDYDRSTTDPTDLPGPLRELGVQDRRRGSDPSHGRSGPLVFGPSTLPGPLYPLPTNVLGRWSSETFRHQIWS